VEQEYQALLINVFVSKAKERRRRRKKKNKHGSITVN
jgi:hypothetical protein